LLFLLASFRAFCPTVPKSHAFSYRYVNEDTKPRDFVRGRPSARMPGGNSTFRTDSSPDRFLLGQIGFWYSRNRSGVKSFDLLQQKTFWCTRNDSGAVEIDLVQQKSIWCEIFPSVTTKIVLVCQNGFWYTKNEFGVVETNQSLMTFGRR
jgi:hypothetical protein